MNLFVCSSMSDLMKMEVIRLHNRLENVVVITDYQPTKTLCNNIGIRCHYVHEYTLADERGVWTTKANDSEYGKLKPEPCVLSHEPYTINLHESIGIDRMRFFSNAAAIKSNHIAFNLFPERDQITLYLSFDLRSHVVSHAAHFLNEFKRVVLIKHDDFYTPVNYLALCVIPNISEAIVSNERDARIFNKLQIPVRALTGEPESKEPVSADAKRVVKKALGVSADATLGILFDKQYDGELNRFLSNNLTAIKKLRVIILPIDKRAWELAKKIISDEFLSFLIIANYREVSYCIQACDQVVAFSFNETLVKNIKNQHDYKFNGGQFTFQNEILSSWVK